MTLSVRTGFKKFLIPFFFAAFFGNGYLSLNTIYDHSMGRKAYTDLREDILEERSLESFSVDTAKEQTKCLQMLPDINETALFQINPDYAAWIFIPNTNIHYPVVYPKDNSAYLTKTFAGQNQSCGCLFFDCLESPFSKPNTIIHGHNMKSGDMFGGLKQYLFEEYARAHSNLFLYHDGSWVDYRLYSVYITDNGDFFPFQNHFPENEDYKRYLVSSYLKSRIKPLDPVDGEELLTLSTCHGNKQKLILQWIRSGAENKGG